MEGISQKDTFSLLKIAKGNFQDLTSTTYNAAVRTYVDVMWTLAVWRNGQ